MRGASHAAVTLLLAGSAAAQEATDPESGAELFFTHCGACHGESGEGDGPVAGELEFAPPDLTRIALRAGGEFPTEKVFRIIDGRDPIEGHGGPEMPIWGDAFRSADEGFDEKAAEERIRRIVAHIATLQKEAE
jgi:mono/diheme cytochrome c family protein